MSPTVAHTAETLEAAMDAGDAEGFFCAWEDYADASTVDDVDADDTMVRFLASTAARSLKKNISRVTKVTMIVRHAQLLHAFSAVCAREYDVC